LSIYWERCDICEKHRPTSPVSYRGNIIRICYECSFLLGAWKMRERESWRRLTTPEEKEKKEEEKRMKVIEELLKEDEEKE
jgi:hypothetical protein